MSNKFCSAGDISFLEPNQTLLLKDIFSSCENEILKGSLVGKIFILTINDSETLNFVYNVYSLKENNEQIKQIAVSGPIKELCRNSVYVPIITTTRGDGVRHNEYLFEFDIGSITYQFMRREESSFCTGAFYFNFLFTVTLNPPKKSAVINQKSLSKQVDDIFIFINSQLLIDLSDIGDTKFIIKDNNNETIYDKSCPKIVSVLKGKGLTAWDKLNYIYKKYNINIGSLFVENIMEYSMAKYLFTKLLYGRFIIEYLKQQYYKKFLSDLKSSKYSNFYNYFTEGKFQNYHEYFKKQ